MVTVTSTSSFRALVLVRDVTDVTDVTDPPLPAQLKSSSHRVKIAEVCPGLKAQVRSFFISLTRLISPFLDERFSFEGIPYADYIKLH